MRKPRVRTVAAILATSVIGAILVYVVYRPWALNWGASREEIARTMPGDGILSNPTFNATRAVTIDATPAEIWPWIAQMGYGKAGFYSYDRLDNDGIPSANHIIAEYQQLETGDSIPLTEHGFVTVTTLEPESSMLWEYRGDDTTTVFTWAWGLYPQAGGQTRLVTRLLWHASSLRSRAMLDLFEIVMMRKCMLGIKRRAETANAAGARRTTPDIELEDATRQEGTMRPKGFEPLAS